jgi:hypothetical protein
VRWFSARPPAEAASPEHRSLALPRFLEALRSGPRPRVLDLGPPVAGNITFLSTLGCRVRIADLQRSLAAEPLETRRPQALTALFERLLPFTPDERIDGLLAWDVFDYLRPDQISSLMARLTPACRPDAPALVLVSTRRQIPAAPALYRILDREHVAGESRPERMRPSPRYRQADLARMAPGFSVNRSFLLRNGIQEYLLVRAP